MILPAVRFLLWMKFKNLNLRIWTGLQICVKPTRRRNILCTYGFGGANAACKVAIKAVAESMNDEKIKSYFFTTVQAPTGHPDVANHQQRGCGTGNAVQAIENHLI